jgi:hypothetical protein
LLQEIDRELSEHKTASPLGKALAAAFVACRCSELIGRAPDIQRNVITAYLAILRSGLPDIPFELSRDLPENAVLCVHDPPVPGAAWLVHADDVAATVRQRAKNHSTERAVLVREVWVYALPDSDGAAFAYGEITISRFDMAARRGAHLAQRARWVAEAGDQF